MTTPNPMAAKTHITRNWKSTFNYLILSVVSAGVSVLLFMYFAEGIITAAISCVPAVLAIIFLFMSISGASETTCPNCKKPLSGLSTGSNDGVLCDGCHLYFEGKNAELWQTDPARIADSPIFSSPVPEKFILPDLCCVCGAPSTQKIKVTLTTTNASSALTATTIGVTTSTRTTIEVPHCADHKDGADLTGTQDRPHIKFRSYPYLRAFCEANQTTPG
jgi:hypothetical protein